MVDEKGGRRGYGQNGRIIWGKRRWRSKMRIENFNN